MPAKPNQNPKPPHDVDLTASSIEIAKLVDQKLFDQLPVEYVKLLMVEMIISFNPIRHTLRRMSENADPGLPAVHKEVAEYISATLAESWDEAQRDGDISTPLHEEFRHYLKS